MSYDYCAIVPEVAGDTRDQAIAAAQRVAAAEPDGGVVDPRVVAFHSELVGIVEDLPDEKVFLSVWPLAPTAHGVFIPVAYPHADEALLTLLRLAARHGLVLVDLSSTTVDHPPPGIPVSVRGGDGTRLGALTHERLSDLVRALGGEDPYLVLDAGDRFAQAYRESTDSYLIEHSDGTAHVGATVASAAEVDTHLWRWLNRDPEFGAGLTFTSV